MTGRCACIHTQIGAQTQAKIHTHSFTDTHTLTAAISAMQDNKTILRMTGGVGRQERMSERVRKWSRSAYFCHVAALSPCRTDPLHDKLHVLSALSSVPWSFSPGAVWERDAGKTQTPDIGWVIERHYQLRTRTLLACSHQAVQGVI